MHIEEHRLPGDWRGEVTLFAEDPETGEVFGPGKNTITLSAREIMAALLGPKEVLKGDDGQPIMIGGKPVLVPDLRYLISEVAWGSGTKPAEREDEALEEFIVATEVAYPVSFDATSVTFQSSINPGMPNTDDKEFSEVGLRSANGKLFARYVFPTLRKFRRLRLTVRWQIFFA